jgi:O-antigen ligase
MFGATRLSPKAFGTLLVAALRHDRRAASLAGGDADRHVGPQFALRQFTAADLSSIDYRRQLLDDSIALLKQRPWTGVPDYQVQLQSLRQGEGIIDIVNTYIVVMLNTGVIGLALYLLPYWIIIRSLLRSLPARRDDPFPPGNRRFVNGMVSLTVASLITIFTTSTIGLMPLLLLMLLALPRAWLAIPSAERTDPNPVEGAALTGLAPGFRRDAMGRPFGQVTR